MTDFRRRIRTADRSLLLLFAGTTLFTMANGGIFEISLNNYLVDVFDISGTARGQLEFPRELPGFLVTAVAGALIFLGDARLLAAAMLLAATGFVGVAQAGDSYRLMVLFLFIQSTGLHLSMPVRESVSLRLAREGKRGTRLGQVAAAGTLGAISGCLVVWLARKLLQADYRALFLVSAGLAVTAGGIFASMRLKEVPRSERPRFVWRKRYGLFYALCTLFGARKQVFLTFGPLVLIRKFGEPVTTFAKLGLVASVISIFFKPQMGRWIDHLGERAVLAADAVVLFLVCLGYGFGSKLGLGDKTVWLLYVCWIVDNIMFAVGMARTTYLDKIAVRQSDVTPTLTLGVTINHVVSMTVPAIGGWVWDRYGYEHVFIGAAVVAILMLLAALRVRTPEGKGVC